MTSEDWEDRYWSKVTKTDGCWHWEGSLRKSRGGSFLIAGISKSAHRVSYELHYGPLPVGIRLGWTCNNKGCVRPDHLTVAKNSRQDPVQTAAIAYSEWTERALCTKYDPRLWDGETKFDVARAKQICAICPVRNDCLAEALEMAEPWTVRGGMTAEERERLVAR